MGYALHYFLVYVTLSLDHGSNIILEEFELKMKSKINNVFHDLKIKGNRAY